MGKEYCSIMVGANIQNISIAVLSPATASQKQQQKDSMPDLFAEETTVKKVARVKGLSLHAIRKRRAQRPEPEEEEGNVC